jgi:hypothetical protein
MRDLFRIGIVILLTSIAVFGQSESKWACPDITINGPDRIVEPGGIASFKATLDEKGQNYRPKILWTISGSNNVGEIVGGQGTMAIDIKLSNAPAGSLTATISLEGLPNGCVATVSASMSMCGAPQPQLIGEFSSARDPKFDAAKVAEIAVAKEANPNAQMFVLMSSTPNSSAAKKVKLIERLRSKLTKNNRIASDDITISTYSSSNASLKIYLVPPGADNPQP